MCEGEERRGVNQRFHLASPLETSKIRKIVFLTMYPSSLAPRLLLHMHALTGNQHYQSDGILCSYIYRRIGIISTH